MTIDINNCDLNNDYFHFTNKSNIYNILNEGLIPSIGVASKLVDDIPNVSVSKGAKGIMGIINSFIYVFSKIEISKIPEEYKKYFIEITDFNKDDLIPKDIVLKGLTRKLKDEVYFQVKLEEEQLEKSIVDGLTGYDIKLPIAINKSKLKIITNNGNFLSAYDVARYIYEKAKNIEIFREMCEDFFELFENSEQFEYKDNTDVRKI